MKMKIPCALMALALTVIAGTANAAVVRLTVTGTANSSLYGYVAGQPYSFHWDLNSAFVNTWEQTDFTATKNFWGDELVTNPATFMNVSGDGLAGTWQRPTNYVGDPYSYIDVRGGTTHNLTLYAGNDAGYSIGLLADGKDIKVVEALYLQVGNIFSFPLDYTDPSADPNVYFAALADSYTVTGGSLTVYAVGDSTGVGFTPTALTIGAVPEPSTALLAGLGLMVPLFRRRCR